MTDTLEHADRRRRRTAEAAEALRPLRHPVLPRLHDRRRGHHRHGRAGRRRGLHLDDDLRGRLLRPAGPAVLRARHGLPAGRRALLLDPAGLRAPGRGGEQLPVLDHQPGLDRRHARHLLHRRRRGVLQQREHRAHRGVLRHRAGLRLGVDRGRDHLVQRGQVAAHGRGLRPVPPARPVHDHRHHLRGQARRPRPGRGELLADGRRLRAPGRRAAVQLRRLRAAEQRGRGDDQPAARRAVRHRPLHRGQRDPLRAAGGRHPDRAAVQRRSPTSAGSSAPSSRSSPCTAGTSRPTARPR